MLELIKAIGGILVLMAIWIAVQSIIRRRMGIKGDVLEDMVHGCGACGHGGCGSRSCEKGLL